MVDPNRSDLVVLNEQLSTELAQLNAGFNAQDEALTEISVRPKSTDIHVSVIGLTWMPFRTGANGRLEAAWRA